MKKILVIGILLGLIATSCSKYVAPPYASTEKIVQLKGGMSVDEVNKTVGLEPHDMYMSGEDAKMIIVYRYRLKGRRYTAYGPGAGGRERKIRSDEAQKDGEVWYEKRTRSLYVTFQNGKLQNYTSSSGRFDSETLLLTNNNIKKINKDELNSYVIYWQKLIEEEKAKLEKEKNGTVIKDDNTTSTANPEANKENTIVIAKRGPRKNDSKSWETLNSYIGLRANVGLVNDNNITRVTNKPRYGGSPTFSCELAYGGNKSEISGYYLNNYTQVKSNSTGYYYGYDYCNVNKFGIAYKQYFADLSSRFRPYAKAGFGITFEDGRKNGTYFYEYYSPVHIQARIGCDLMVTKFYGINMEAGVGANSIISFGTIIRINQHR